MDDEMAPVLPNGHIRPGYWLEQEARQEIIDRYGDGPRDAAAWKRDSQRLARDIALRVASKPCAKPEKRGHWTAPGARIDVLLGQCVAGLTAVDRQTNRASTPSTDVIRDLLAEIDRLVTELELKL